MKKITLTLAMASMIAATSMATEPTNLIQNGDVETALTVSYTDASVPGTTFIPFLKASLTLTTATKPADTPVGDGIWVRKSSAAGCIKGYVTNENESNKVIGMLLTGTGVPTTLGGFNQFVVGQRLTASLDKTKQYLLSYRVKQNNDILQAGSENKCVEIQAALYQISGTDIKITTTHSVTADWQTHTHTFDLSTQTDTAFTAEKMMLAFSIKAVHDETDAGAYTHNGAYIDDISLTELIPNSINTTEKANAQVTGQAGSVRIVSEAGANVALYTLSGTLVSNIVLNSNEASMDAKAGLYLVKVDNMTYKTIVK